jgi:arsenate reductase
MPVRKLRVLFLCTGNSCRSQMAQGWANHLGGDSLEARSAGVEAHGLNPRAVAVMREVGVNISVQTSRQVSPELLNWADMVITVCDHADAHCPAPPADVMRQHWSLADPAKASGSEAEIMTVFRTSRDEIRTRILGLIQALHHAAAASVA